MADDAASLVVQIRADQSRFQREMSKIARDASRAADRVEKGFQSANSKAATSFNKIGSAAQDGFRRAERGAQSYSSKLDQISRKMELLSSKGGALGGLGSLAGSFGAGIIGGAVAAVSTREIAQLIDASTRMRNALKVAGLEGQNLENTFQRLGKVAMDNGADMESLVGLYARMTQSAKALGISQDQVFEFSRRMAVGLKASGTDAQQASDGIRQLNQAMASGLLRGDEFNSVMENLPVVANAIAKGLGVTTGELRKMAEAGELTAQTVFAAFMKGSTDLDAQAAKTQNTFSQSMRNIGTALTLAADKFNNLTGVSAGFASLANNAIVPAINNVVDALIRGTKFAQSFNEELLASANGGKKMTDAQQAQEEATRQNANAFDGLINLAKEYEREITQIANDTGNLDLSASFTDLEDKIANGTATAEDFNKVINLLVASGQDIDLQLTSKIIGLQAAFSATAATAKDQTAKAFQDVFNAMVQIGEDGKGALGNVNAQLTIMGQLTQKVVDQLNQFGTVLDPLKQFSAGNDTPVFNFGNLDMEKMLGDGDKAMKLISKYEGFITRAKWDVNAFRVGFGSDTFVDGMGQIQKVTKDTVVTFEQATVDLARRTREFQESVIKAIGPDMWKSLDEDQKAALTSIAYNYGSLPDRIASQIRAGASRGQVADAIRDLGSDNKGINAGRRRQEAEIYGGSGYSAGSDRIKKESKDLDEWLSKSQQALDLKQKELLIDKDITATQDEKSAAKEREKLIQEGLLAVQAQYGTVSEENRQKVIAMADAMSKAGLASDQLKTKQSELKEQQEKNSQATAQMAEQYAQIAKTAFSGFVNDLRNGVSAGEAFANMLDRIVDGLINMAIEALFSKEALGGLLGGGGTGGGGGFLSKILGIGMHKGGVVGRDATFARAVPASAFVGAKRYQRGGVAGFAPGEVPAILHKGEVVIPKGATAQSANNDNRTFNNNVAIKVDSQGNAVITKDEGVGLGKRLNLVVQEEIARQQRAGGLLAGTGPGRR